MTVYEFKRFQFKHDVFLYVFPYFIFIIFATIFGAPSWPNDKMWPAGGD